ncbi:MAG TPA: glycine zipper 2TM domain-containing protein [Noviherbaspirillum sp.]
MNTFTSKVLPILLSAAVLGGCASPGYNVPVASQPYPAYPSPVQTYPTAAPSHVYSTGTIDAIQMRQSADAGIGVGAVVGGVVGGLLGNQVGGGRGKKAATVAGVVGGAMVGHQMERNAQARDAYDIRVRMDNGTYQTVTQDSIADLQVGSRVRIENQRVYRYW